MKEFSIGEIITKNSCSQIIEPQTMIDDFFSPLNEETKQKWPFDFSKEGYQTTYQQAVFLPPRDCLRDPGEGIKISAVIRSSQESFFMERGFYLYDDQLTIELKHLYRVGFGNPNNFAYKAVCKFKDFIDAYDASRPDGKTDPSKLELEAVSNADKSNIAALGGYVWANMGFEFKDKNECYVLQQRFKAFAKHHSIDICQADLKYFTQPCHFAAFDCGIKVTDKFGHSSSLGKAFMLFESWKGVIYSGDKKGEAALYAEKYNNPKTRLQSQKVFNSGYRSVVNKYTKRYSNNKANKIICFGHQMLRKLSSRF